MSQNQKKKDISLIIMDKSLNQDIYETTYKSSYCKFNPNEKKMCNNNINYYQYYASNNLPKMKENNRYKYKNKNLENCMKNKQEKNQREKPKLLCPNCVNDNLLKAKSMNKINKRKVNETEFFEDKMREMHEYKRINDIKNRENKAKNTYISLFKNRDRSAGQYKKFFTIDQNKSYFGEDIEYGMQRCRNRELKNDRTLFGLDSPEKNEKSSIIIKNLKNNKSWIGPKNYLLDKNEYSFIINKQISKDKLRLKKERYDKLKEEKCYLNYQLKKEKNDIDKEIYNKNKRKNEMNQINSYLLKAKKKEECRQKKIKKQEKDSINLICKKQFEEMMKSLKEKKLKNINIGNTNLKMTEERRIKNEKEKILLNRNYEGLNFKGVERKSCEKCNKIYPKNVLSYMLSTYNDKQKNCKDKL